MLSLRRCLVPLAALLVVAAACSSPRDAASAPSPAPTRASLLPLADPSRPPRLEGAPPDAQQALEALQTVLRTMFPLPPPTTTAAQVIHPPTPQQTPGPVSARGCSGAIETEIETIFGPAAAWASSIVWRESRCDPRARNASGAEGLMQLLGHDDLLAAVCPGVSPSVSWSMPRCNLLAGKSLYDGSGTAPWSL